MMSWGELCKRAADPGDEDAQIIQQLLELVVNQPPEYLGVKYKEVFENCILEVTDTMRYSQ